MSATQTPPKIQSPPGKKKISGKEDRNQDPGFRPRPSPDTPREEAKPGQKNKEKTPAVLDPKDPSAVKPTASLGSGTDTRPKSEENNIPSNPKDPSAVKLSAGLGSEAVTRPKSKKNDIPGDPKEHNNQKSSTKGRGPRGRSRSHDRKKKDERAAQYRTTGNAYGQEPYHSAPNFPAATGGRAGQFQTPVFAHNQPPHSGPTSQTGATPSTNNAFAQQQEASNQQVITQQPPRQRNVTYDAHNFNMSLGDTRKTSDPNQRHEYCLETDVDMTATVAERKQQYEGMQQGSAMSHLQDKNFASKLYDKAKNVGLRIVSAVSGDNTKVSVYGSTFNMDTGDKTINNTYNEDDFKCQSLKVVQSQPPASEFISGANITWDLPKARKYVKKIQVIISDRSGEVCHSPHLTKFSKEWKIDDRKLECGKRYHTTIYCTYSDELGDFQHPSGDIDFYTRPAKPKDFKITCQADSFTLKWSTSTGNCDKHYVEIYDKDKDVLLDRKEVKGLVQECKFDVDMQRNIYLGREYKFKVTSYYEDQDNPSNKEKLFVGDKNGPQEVRAKFIGNTNDVELTWKKPDGSSWNSKVNYIVEVLTENKVFININTTDTKSKIDGLKQGTSYTFQVAAITSNGMPSLWIVSNSLKTKSSSVKVEKFNVQRGTEDSATTLYCTWDPPTGVEEYKLRYRQGNNSFVMCLGKDCKEYVIRDLLPNTVYRVAIKADQDGYGPYTTPETITTDVGQVSKAWLELDKDNLDSVVVKYNEALNATCHIIALRDSSAEDQPRVHTDDGLFTDLKNNCSYYAIVTPKYGRDKGKEKQTQEILTAPKAPLIMKNNFILDEENPSSVFHLSWKSQPNCCGEEVKISCLDFNDEPQILRHERESNEDGKCFLTYRGGRSGCKYGVQMRTQNRGGFSEWSKPFEYTTVPAKVSKIELEIVEDQITCSWDASLNANNYKVILHEYKLNGEWEELEVKETSGRRHSFNTEAGHGILYACKVIPYNTTGEGETAWSNTELSPLLPPKDLTFKFTDNGIQFCWKKSIGMSSAKVQLTDYEKFKVEKITNQSSWSPFELYDGTSYEFKVWARNGSHLSNQYASISFATAPNDVIVKRNKENPETSLDVEVVTSHDGPFTLIINGDKYISFRSRHYVIKDCQPATKYVIGAQSIFDKNKTTSITFGKPVTTFPAKVSGVTCFPIEDTSGMTLKWENCGNPSINYKISWSKDYIPLHPITCKSSEHKFVDLKPGTYEFKVSAGGADSDPYTIIVPESPKINVEILTSKLMHITCDNVDHADNYIYKILSDNLDTLKTLESKQPDLWVDEHQFQFQVGALYLLAVQACCHDNNEQNHTSLPTKRWLYAGLEKPSDLKVNLDNVSPTSKAECTWNKSPGMLKAKIQVQDSKRNIIEALETPDLKFDLEWLEPNQTYEVKIWPGDGKMFFHDDCASLKFVTAPNQPDKVTCTQNKQDRTHSIDVTIYSDYSGPFIVHVLDSRRNIAKEPIETNDKSMTVTNLQAGGSYFIYVQCKFGDYLTAKTHGMYCK
ncbi:receptor-type tyrosine-protein phosphatase beta-like isoform X2 [Styela clava]